MGPNLSLPAFRLHQGPRPSSWICPFQAAQSICQNLESLKTTGGCLGLLFFVVGALSHLRSRPAVEVDFPHPRSSQREPTSSRPSFKGFQVRLFCGSQNCVACLSNTDTSTLRHPSSTPLHLQVASSTLALIDRQVLAAVGLRKREKRKKKRPPGAAKGRKIREAQASQAGTGRPLRRNWVTGFLAATRSPSPAPVPSPLVQLQSIFFHPTTTTTGHHHAAATTVAPHMRRRPDFWDSPR